MRVRRTNNSHDNSGFSATPVDADRVARCVRRSGKLGIGRYERKYRRHGSRLGDRRSDFRRTPSNQFGLADHLDDNGFSRPLRRLLASTGRLHADSSKGWLRDAVVFGIQRLRRPNAALRSEAGTGGSGLIGRLGSSPLKHEKAAPHGGAAFCRREPTLSQKRYATPLGWA